MFVLVVGYDMSTYVLECLIVVQLKKYFMYGS